MNAHEISWRQLALGGGAKDESSTEAFTPAFQFSAFRFVEVTYGGEYDSSTTPGPDEASLACHRIGAGFDWTGDVVVAPPPPPERPAPSAPSASGEPAAAAAAATAAAATTAAERFNAVVAATRSTAISNYLMDIPTDCPHREKRGWTGDSLAAHSAVSSFFDMRTFDFRC